MRIEPQAASRLEAIPVALIAQSVTVLAQNAESLRRTIDAFVLGNPLLEYAPAGANPAEALDIAELAVARRTWQALTRMAPPSPRATTPPASAM